MRQYKHILILGLLILGMGISSPSIEALEPQQSDLNILATTTIIADALTNIVGDTISISTLMGSGIDPHDYEPTPSDLITVNSSDYIFWTGIGVEAGLESILELKSSQNKALSLLSVIPEEDLIIGGHDHDEDHEGESSSVNPHFWLDPLLWLKAVDAITQKLIDLNPDDQEFYEIGFQSYENDIENLHQKLLSDSQRLNENQRFLITPHDSFPYFAHRYDFQIRSLEGISTESQAGIQEIDELAIYLKENNISVVFAEYTTTSDSLEAVVDAARAMGHPVSIGGTLSAGSLTSDILSYFDLMEYNMDTIVENILNPPTVSESLLNFPALLLIPALFLYSRGKKE